MSRGGHELSDAEVKKRGEDIYKKKIKALVEPDRLDDIVAIDVMNAAAFAILDKNRVRLVVPVIAGNPKRDAFQSTLVRRG